jgi:hypothetical protein
VANDCERILRETIFRDQEIPPSLMAQIVKDLENIKKSSANYPEGGSYKSRAMEYIKDQQELSKLELARRADNLIKTSNIITYLKQPAFKNHSLEGLRSILDFSTRLANGGKDSVAGNISALKSDYQQLFFGGLEREKVSEAFMSRKFDEDIQVAVDAISRGKVPEGVAPEAIKIATILDVLNRRMFQDMRDAGAPVRFMPGYVTAQTHDMAKVASTEFEVWANDIFPLLDRKKTFKENAGRFDEEMKQLKHIYKAVSSGQLGADTMILNSEVEDMIIGTGMTRSAAQKLSAERFFAFLGPKEAHKYNSMYGNGSLAENVFQDMNRKSTLIGAMKKLGSNPEASYAAAIDREITRQSKLGDTAAADNIKAHKQDLLHSYGEIMGKNSVPGQGTFFKISNTIKQINVASKLSDTGIRSITNLAGSIIQHKNSSGKNLFESTTEVLQEFVKAIPKEQQTRFMQNAGHAMLDTSYELAMAGGDIDPTAKPGFLSRGIRTMFKYNLLDFLTRTPKIVNGNLFMKDMADNAGKLFKDLSPTTQAMLLTAGIKAEDFQFLKHAIETQADGRSMVTAEAIGRIDPKLVAEHVKTLSRKAGGLEIEISPEKYIRDLQLKYSQHIIQVAHFVSTTPSARVKAAMRFGQSASTKTGDAISHAMMFKSFMVQSWLNTIMIKNGKPDMAMLGQGFAVSSGTDKASLAQMFIIGTTLAYGGQALIDLAHGRAVKDPTKVDTWVDAMTKSGIGAGYIDFLGGESHIFNAAENMLGPTFGQFFGPVASATATGRHALIDSNEKSGRKAAASFVRIARQNIPFSNLPLVKEAVDFGMHKTVYEALNPGHGRKRKAFLESKSNQKNRTDISIPNLYDKLTGE